MRRLSPLLAAGCVLVLQPQHLCDEIAQAVALRTLQCTDDAHTSTRNHDAFVDGASCSIDESLDSASEPQWVMRCSAAILAAGCADVRDFGDDADFWLSQHRSCGDAYSGGEWERPATPTTPTQPTGTTPTDPGYIGPGSCNNPTVVDLTSAEYGQAVQIHLAQNYGDSTALRSCTPTGVSDRDVVFQLVTDREGPVTLTLLSMVPEREDPWMAIYAANLGCEGELERCFAPGWGVAQELYKPPSEWTERVIAVQQTANYDWSANYVQVLFTQLDPRNP